MIDIVRKKGLSKMALKLGYSDVLVVGDSAKIIDKSSGRGKEDLVLYCGNDVSVFNRNIDIVFSPHRGAGKDKTHYRDSGLNQVLVKEMKAKGIMFGIDYVELVKLKGMLLSQVIGRVMQNVRLCRKYGVGMCMFSLASISTELRAPHDLKALCEILGMTPLEASRALEAVGKRVSLNKKKKSGKILREGVEVI